MSSEHPTPERFDDGPVEVMAPAPELAPVLGAGRAGDRRATPAPRSERAPAAAERAPAVSPAPVSSPAPDVVAALLAHHGATTELHERFLHQQARFYAALPALAAPTARPAVVDELIDPAVDDWLADHRPDAITAVLPGTAIADRLAAAAARYGRRPVVGLRDVRLRRWVTVRAPVLVRTEVNGPVSQPTATLSMWHASRTPGLSRFVPVAGGRVLLGDPLAERADRFDPLVDARPRRSPYGDGGLFHGPRLQCVVSQQAGATGSSAVLDCARSAMPAGELRPGVLDGALHAIAAGAPVGAERPDEPRAWFGFPQRFVWLRVFEALPGSGPLDVETRFAGFDADDGRAPVFDLQLCRGERVLVDMRVVLGLLPRAVVRSLGE